MKMKRLMRGLLNIRGAIFAALISLCIILSVLPVAPERVKAETTVYAYEDFEWGSSGDQLVDGGGPNEWRAVKDSYGTNAVISAGPPGLRTGGLVHGGSRCAWLFGDGAKIPLVGIEYDPPDEVFECSFYMYAPATGVEAFWLTNPTNTLCVRFGVRNSGRVFWYEAVGGSSGRETASPVVPANTWTHIRAYDIDWDNLSYKIEVNGTTVWNNCIISAQAEYPSSFMVREDSATYGVGFWIDEIVISSTDAAPVETVNEHGAQVLTYDTPGTYEWTCPEDVVGLKVETWGGGGAGGLGNATRGVGHVPCEASAATSKDYTVRGQSRTLGPCVIMGGSLYGRCHSVASSTGDVYLRVRKKSDGAVLGTLGKYPLKAMGTSLGWFQVIGDPVVLAEPTEVVICAEHAGAGSSYFYYGRSNSSYVDGSLCYWSAGSWACDSRYDFVVEALVWTQGGQGGGGGAYSRSEIEVSPDKQYSIVVGTGGVSRMGSGGDSHFKYGPDTLVKAVGAIAEAGGSADDCIGDVRYSGGAGYVPSAEFWIGGGGGGSGGYSSSGEDGDGNVGGLAIAGGAPGANGSSYGMPGLMGVGPGGGGGGPGVGNNQGGHGGHGQVRITYIYVVELPVLRITVADVPGTNVRLNGELLDDGGENCTVSLVWGQTNGKAVLGDWDYVGVADEPEQPQAAGEFYRDIEVEAGQIYYWSATAVNSGGRSWADVDVFAVFEGGPGPPSKPCGPPTLFTVAMVGDGMSVSLSWDLGENATFTLVRYSVEDYPTNPSEGAAVYFDTGTSAVHDLSFGEIEKGSEIYYSAWGVNGSGYSSLYVTASTKGGNAMLLISLIGLACFFTFFSGWRRYLPSSMAAAVAWLALGALWLTSPATIGVTVNESWTTYIGFVFILATIIPIMLYLKPLTTLRKSRGGLSWQEQGTIPNDPETRSQRVQREYKERLRGKIASGQRRGIGPRKWS